MPSSFPRASFSVAVSLALLSGPALCGSAGAMQSYNMNLLSNVDVYTGANDCWGYTSPGGTELAIYGHRTGTSFVDATNPSQPVEVLNVPGPTSAWRDIKTYQNYAYVVTEGTGTGEGIQIVDLSNPLAPVHVATYTGSGYAKAHNIWIDTAAGVAYACGGVGGGMHILSLANPESPAQLDYFNPYYIHDLYVGNGRAYAGAINSNSLRIIDVSNPSSPFTLASHFYSGAVTHNAWPNLAETHCLTSDETGGGHLRIWDITNLSNISLAGEYRPSNEGGAVIHNVLGKDDMAYISYYLAGVRVVDVTDPTNPVEVGYYDTHPDPGGSFDGDWGVYHLRDDDVVYASDRQTGLYILEFTGAYAGDVSGVVRDAGTSAPIEGAVLDLLGAPQQFATDTTGAYAGAVAGGTYTVVTGFFGYFDDTSTVVVPENGAVVHDVDLMPLPSGAVELHLAETGTGNPVAGAKVDVTGTPIGGLISDGSGVVSIAALPAGTSWTVRIGKFGRALTSVPVVPTQGNTLQVNVEIPPGFFDDFDTDQAWIVGAVDDDATGGVWERAVPVSSSIGGPVGPGADASPSGAGFAFVTENPVPGAFVGTSDVDNGKTTLLSPVFDGSGLGDLTLSYQRWFSNRAPSQDNDEFRTDVSTDGGGTWTNLETVNVGTDSWAAVSIDVTAVVPATSTMQIRFVAEDVNASTYVEGGVDDVEIVTSATAAELPGAAGTAGLQLSAPVPNPSSEGAVLAFRLPSSGPASLDVFDVTGRRVAVLLRGDRVAAGTHRARWSGEDARGRRVAPGVYFVRLTSADGTLSRKLVRMR